jgi:UDP-N-acetylmuramoyl-tripeptide--D-alanyl-D-alanine ligase
VSVGSTDPEVREALALFAGPEVDDGNGAPSAYTEVSTDTRSIRPGALFVALRGEVYDAHNFLAQAAEAGASGAVVERRPDEAPARLAYYIVPDTLVALGDHARFRRRRLSSTEELLSKRCPGYLLYSRREWL